MASHKQFPGNVCKSGNWSRHVIPESNKPYYYNCVSKVSQWEKPKEWVDRDLAANIPQTLPLPRQQYVHVVLSDSSSDEDDILFDRDSVKKQQALLYSSSDDEERSDSAFIRDKGQHSVKKQQSAEGFGGVPNSSYNYNYGRNLASVTPRTSAQTLPTSTQWNNQQLEKWKQKVLKVFPDVELQFLEDRLLAHSGPNAVNHVCEELLEMPDYPKSASVVKPVEEKIECGCCCTEHNFEDMVQCTEGHLFCRECLHRLVRGAADGSGKSNLTCMSTNGCQASYPQSVIEKAVPRETLRRYDEKVREENINRAGISNLERCPHCNYAAIIEDEGKSFRCQNKDCMKETCRQCKEDWTNHVGLTCDQVEKNDETKLRKKYEERMTEAKVRTCHRCKTEFTKDEGCNRMTCNCGATMCYICRAPGIQYNHFCQHPKEPCKRCTQCTACSLWTNPHEDDERAIEEIKRKARKRRREMGFEKDRSIGVPSQPKAKKCRGHLNN